MNTKDFLKHFKSENSNIEFTKISNGHIQVIKETEAIENKNDNIYFLGGIKKDLVYVNGTRAKDDDIIEKNYLILDLDIAKNFEEEFGETCSYEDIEKEGLNLIENLKYEDEYFSEFSFVIISGGGLHLYYMGDFTSFTKEEYSLGVSRIYKQWNKIMGSKTWECDTACKNIARILRLPGSINQKNGKECRILFGEQKNSNLFKHIKGFALKEQEEKEKIKQKRQKEIEAQLQKFNKEENNFYEQINSIPAYQIAEILVPFKLSKNGKNFDNEKKGYCGYYYVPETNTICNGGSRFFNWGDDSSCWNNFSLVKQHKNFTNNETFNFFKIILGKK